MVCPVCTKTFDGVGSFCPHCGARMGEAGGGGPQQAGFRPHAYGYAASTAYAGVPPYAVAEPTRVRRNLQLLSILWGSFAVYRLASGLAEMFLLRAMAAGGVFGHHFPFGSHFPFGLVGSPFFSALLPFSVITLLAMVGLAAITAYGLSRRRPWGRTMAIVIGIVSLLKFPFGTALGIYTLWMLASDASAAEYEMIADRTRPGF